jgi:DNA repair exonuclease SbcCD ATPase subunit
MDTTLANRLAAYHGTASQVKQQLFFEEQNLTRLNARIAQIEKDKTQLVLAVGLIDRCIQIISANGIGKIESIVSGGLQMVFNDKSMGLILNKKETARGSSYELLMRQGDFTGKPMESFGGGVVNVISFLLRVIMVKRFRLAKFLALDESFNNVSEGHLGLVSEMLQKLCRDHGFTILAVTHQPVLAQAADRAYRITDEDMPRLVLEGLRGTQEPENTPQAA